MWSWTEAGLNQLLIRCRADANTSATGSVSNTEQGKDGADVDEDLDDEEAQEEEQTGNMVVAQYDKVMLLSACTCFAHPLLAAMLCLQYRATAERGVNSAGCKK